MICKLGKSITLHISIDSRGLIRKIEVLQNANSLIMSAIDCTNEAGMNQKCEKGCVLYLLENIVVSCFIRNEDRVLI